MNSIDLTAKQKEIVKWALDIMPEHWCTDFEGTNETGGPIYPETALPELKGSTLRLSEIAEINSDLHYRVCEQMRQMTIGQDESISRSVLPTIRNLRKKLEAAGVEPEDNY